MVALLLLKIPVISLERGDYVPPESAFVQFGFKRTGKHTFRVSEIKPIRVAVEPKGVRLNKNFYPYPDYFWKNKTLYAPAPFVAYIITKVIKGYVYWDYKAKRFIKKKEKPTVRDIKLADRGDSVELKITFARKHLKAHLDPTKPSLLLLKVPKGFCWKTWKLKGDGSAVLEVRVKHTARGMELEVALGERAAGFSLSERAKSLSLFVYKSRRPKKRRRKIDLVVIDPGHGGKDPGALGPGGLKEKDITLSVAKELKGLLERMGIKVILTRNGDEFVTLGDRARIANRAGADMFISIHCNWGKRKSARGTETYFLSEARTDWERSVAALENKALEYEMPEAQAKDIISYIIADMMQNEYLKESQELAHYIQEGIVKAAKTQDRGVKQAGFYVLVGAYMPAVLVEIGFISNPKEARRLKSKAFQKKIAQGIAMGVKRFKAKYEK